MKARVKATGALLEVRLRNTATEHPYICDMQGENGTLWKESELEFLDDDPDYWTRLEHQYAGMAMQGLMTILPNIGGLEGRTPKDEIVDIATATAHALVQKLKEERK